ncbi:acyl-CoA dehydrogenase family protein [Nocardia suismassiliense]|uniref:acyl-CoA dehydrogenase family protein n=1 Tax=Nocardia suismassiliense TaxID=2077092 RepID=UPI000D1EAA24|nr:acyl-CoA dehydrogenase family protein [Nocardia suismassiliense]
MSSRQINQTHTPHPKDIDMSFLTRASHHDTGALRSPQRRPHLSVDPGRGLSQALFGDGEHYLRHLQIRDVLAELGDLPGTGQTQTTEARASYTLLERAIDALGGSARAIAADDLASYALFDWSAALAPRLLALLSGHLKLSIAAIENLGDGSAFQQDCLRDLDTGRATGVTLITELGHGTDAIHLETTATWQPEQRCVRLDSPTPASVKFMPNLAAEVPRCVVVLARLIVDGTDEGVWPFLMRLRTADGLAAGVDIKALPDNGFGLWMDNAMTRFHGALLPESALLGGEVAGFDATGRFHCELTTQQRFARTVSPLSAARLGVAGAAVSAARAGLGLAIGYGHHRRVGPDSASMISHDHVAGQFAHAMSDVWAMTCLVNAVRAHCARDDIDSREVALWAMLTKPVASYTAWTVTTMCRHRCAAQGILRANYLTDYVTACEGILTAEGETWATLGAAGRAVRRAGIPRLIDAGEQPRAWWYRLLAERERALAQAPNSTRHPDRAAIDLATAVTTRTAVDALWTAAADASSPAVQRILYDLAALYGLRHVREHADWYDAHGLLGRDRATRLNRDLWSRTAAVEYRLPILARSFALPENLPAPIAGDTTARWIEFAGWHNTFSSADTRTENATTTGDVPVRPDSLPPRTEASHE